MLTLGVQSEYPALQDDLADWLNEETGTFDMVEDVPVFFSFKQNDGQSTSD